MKKGMFVNNSYYDGVTSDPYFIFMCDIKNNNNNSHWHHAQKYLSVFYLQFNHYVKSCEFRHWNPSLDEFTGWVKKRNMQDKGTVNEF